MKRSWLVVRLALRHMRASPSTWVVGGIVLLISMLIVVGGSVVADMGTAVSRSVTDSFSGDLQAYSAASPDDLDLFQMAEGNATRLEPIPDFAAVQRAFAQVPNVRALIPMGLTAGYLSGESPLDTALVRLRGEVRKKLAGQPVDPARLASLERWVRQVATVMLADFTDASATFSQKELGENLQALKRATSDAFWQHFDQDPLASLDFLDDEIAPQLSEGEPIGFGLLGTDLGAFAKNFGRLQIVEGTTVPPGAHGILISKYYYEHQLKLSTAQRLDDVHDARAHGKKIAEDPELQLAIRTNQYQLRPIILQLDDVRTAEMTRRLQKELGVTTSSLHALLASFFDMDDANFDARYAFFYDQLAPLIQIYRARVGDTITVRCPDRRGNVNSLNLTLYGTYQFRGLESSDSVGGINLVDLASFRRLYGFSTPQERAEENALAAELAAIRAGVDPDAAVAPATVVEKGPTDPVLNIAISLKDAAAADATQQALMRASDQAHLNLKIVSWQDAAGDMGHVAQLAGVVLGIAVFLVLLVTLVIVNNASMMTTLQRTREIGTVRAMGGGRRLVLMMVLAESAATAVVFGAVGSALGSAVVLGLGKFGIPAPNGTGRYLFGGPRLWPTLHPGLTVLAEVVILFAILASTFSPALFAAKISPLRAMQAED